MHTHTHRYIKETVHDTKKNDNQISMQRNRIRFRDVFIAQPSAAKQKFYFADLCYKKEHWDKFRSALKSKVEKEQLLQTVTNYWFQLLLLSRQSVFPSYLQTINQSINAINRSLFLLHTFYKVFMHNIQTDVFSYTLKLITHL